MCRRLLHHLAILLLAAIALPASGRTPQQPNIVLIMADDLGYGSLGSYGGREIKTPHLDRLAAGGMRFTDFHSNGAMCSPTRAALLTGRYPQRCAWVPDEELSPVFRDQRKANMKQRWAWGVATEELTLPDLLGQAGYRTALIGKWHLGYDIAFHPMRHGFDEFRGFLGGSVDYHTHVANYGLKQLDWWKGKAIENETGYTTDLLTRYATEFIARNKQRPFFLYLTHAAPHDPWQGRESRDKKPAAETYKEMIRILDESVGKIIDALHENGLENNSLLIFTSDNGGAPPEGVAANGRLKGRKGSLFEGGHRVPMIASWPGVLAAGSMNHETVMSMDFLPTFAALAGAKIPEGHVIDGIDLMPLFKGGPKLRERNLHWLFGDSWAVRKRPWKLMGNAKRATRLVNLENDLEETTNLLEQEPERVAEMLDLQLRWIKSVGSE